MIIEHVRRVDEGGVIALRAHVRRHREDRPPIDFYYRFFGLDAAQVDDSADPFAAACLIKAMRANEPLEIEQPIAPRLHVMLPRIRDIYHHWWPDLFRQVPIRSRPRDRPDPAPVATTATFFSGGVDSFYSLLKHQQEGQARGRPLSHLVFMRGVETPLERARGVEASEHWVREVAAAIGVGVVFGVTNIRSHIMSNWEKYDHGSALASIGLCLAPMIGHMCIPSAFSYRHQVPHGSTPLVDEMFSSDRMFVFHDGAEVTRAQKVEAIVRWNKAIGLRYLRVCLGNGGGAYNCGRCRKCVRTAIPLRVMGVLGEMGSFQLDTDDHWPAVLDQDHLELLRENLEFAQRHKADPALVALLERAMKKKRLAIAMQELEALTLGG